MGAVKQQFFPTSDRPEVMVEVQMSEGSSIEATAGAVAKVEAWLKQQPEAKIVTSYIGQGAPRFFFAMSPELPDPSFAKIIILTANAEAREALKLRLRQKIAEGLAPEARLRVTQLVFGPYSPFPVAFRVTGPDPQVLRNIADQVQGVMRANPSMRQVNRDWGERVPTAHFVLDQDRLRLIGLSPTEAAQQLQFLLTGVTVTQVREDIRTVDVVARSAGAARLDPARLAVPASSASCNNASARSWLVGPRASQRSPRSPRWRVALGSGQRPVEEHVRGRLHPKQEIHVPHVRAHEDGSRFDRAKEHKRVVQELAALAFLAARLGLGEFLFAPVQMLRAGEDPRHDPCLRPRSGARRHGVGDIDRAEQIDDRVPVRRRRRMAGGQNTHRDRQLAAGDRAVLYRSCVDELEDRGGQLPLEPIDVEGGIQHDRHVGGKRRRIERKLLVPPARVRGDVRGGVMPGKDTRNVSFRQRARSHPVGCPSCRAATP
jgi:hypothetical protein